MRISDWSSDVCSSDLPVDLSRRTRDGGRRHLARRARRQLVLRDRRHRDDVVWRVAGRATSRRCVAVLAGARRHGGLDRSEEHTSELQSLMRISYAVFCLKKKKTQNSNTMK